MKTRIQSLTVLVLLVAFSTGLHAQQRYYDRADRPGFNRGQCVQMYGNQNAPQHARLMMMLDLSDDQAAQIQKIHTNGQKEMLALRTTLQQKRAELNTLTIGDNYDEAKVNQLADEIAGLRAQMMKDRASHQQQIKQILNEDQRVQFDRFHLNRGGKMMGANCGRGWNR